MSLEIYVDAYSGYKANERPRQFELDEDIFEIEEVEEQWRSPEAAFFKVRATDGGVTFGMAQRRISGCSRVILSVGELRLNNAADNGTLLNLRLGIPLSRLA